MPRRLVFVSETKPGKFFKELTGLVIWEGGKETGKELLGVAFVSLCGALASRFLSDAVRVLTPYRTLIAITAGIGVGWAVLTIRRRSSKFLPRFEPFDIDFQLIEKSVSFEYVDRENMLYRKKVRVRALRNGLSSYPDKYRWTGLNTPTVRSLIHDQEFAHTFRKSVWQNYEVRLPITLQKGNEASIEIEWALQDTQRAHVPFVSCTIDEPTDKLTLNVTIPPVLGVREAVIEVSGGIGSKKPFSSEKVALDGAGRYQWVVSEPKPLYHYELRWQFPT